MNTVFLAAAKFADINTPDNDLCRSLQSAGLTTFLPTFLNKTEAEIKTKMNSMFQKSEASVHLFGNEYGEKLLSNSNFSINHFMFDCAKEYQQNNPNFKIFIWHYADKNSESNNPEQADFVASVRNNITANMSFSNVVSVIQFVDDIRNSLEVKEAKVYDLKDLEVFFISNELDEIESVEILDMLSDVVSAEQLQIVQDSDIDYSEYCHQQIGKSKLAVVYFKESADWALPFAQQIWKKMGGAAAKTPILLIGDEDPDTNLNKKFKAPKVISLVMAGILIPLEIKVTYDKAKDGVLI